MNSLRIFSAALILLGGVSSFAADTVFEKTISDDSTNAAKPTAHFMVNTDSPDLKRGWVQLTYDKMTTSDSDGPTPHPTDIHIPNLNYAPESKELIYTKTDGKKVVCANKIEKGFFSGLSMTDTGKCAVEVTPDSGATDNGFAVKKSHGYKISFVVKE